MITDTFLDFLFLLLNSEKRRPAFSGSSFKKGKDERKESSGTSQTSGKYLLLKRRMGKGGKL